MARLKGVSDCPNEVVIYFDSGVAVYLEPEPSPPTDPAAFWQKLADQEPPGTATVGVVRSVPALIIDVAAKPPGGAAYLGGVGLFEAGLHIDVAGNGEIPAGDLIAVAETLQPA